MQETIKIYQMQDSLVTVRIQPAFANVIINFLDKQRNPIELHMDMESGLRVIRDFDRFEAVEDEFNKPLVERLQDPWVTAGILSCVIAWITVIYVTWPY